MLEGNVYEGGDVRLGGCLQGCWKESVLGEDA